MGVEGEAGAAGEGVEASARFENLVIEALIEDWGDSRLMIYSHFETAYYLTKGVLRGRLDGDEQVKMVGHQGILEDAGDGVGLIEGADFILDCHTDMSSADIGGAKLPARDGRVAAKHSEILYPRCLIERHHIDALASVVMPGSTIDLPAHLLLHLFYGGFMLFGGWAEAQGWGTFVKAQG